MTSWVVPCRCGHTSIQHEIRFGYAGRCLVEGCSCGGYCIDDKAKPPSIRMTKENSMAEKYIYGYAPRTHGLYGFGYTTSFDVCATTEYCGNEIPLAAPPRAMPVRSYQVECKHCHVSQDMPEIGLCACCGAPL